MRPNRWTRLLAAPAALLLAVTTTPALAAPPAALAPAPGESAEIIGRIDAALRNADFAAAKAELTKLRQLVKDARAEADHGAATSLQNQAEAQARRILDAEVDHALSRRRSGDEATAAEQAKSQAKTALDAAEKAMKEATSERAKNYWAREVEKAREVYRQANREAAEAEKRNNHYWEAVVANWIRPEVVDFNRSYTEPQLDKQRRAAAGDTRNFDSEVDVEAKDFIVEVTAGDGGGKLTQIVGSLDDPKAKQPRPGLLKNRTVNPSGKRVVLFAVKGIKSDQVRQKLQNAGVRIVSTKTELDRAVAEVKKEVKQAKEKKKAQARVNLGLKPGPVCSTGGLGGSGHGGQAMAVVRLKAPCGPSAIDKMLDGKNLGGVDFSTLEMRYMSDGSSGVKYSFSGKPSASGGAQDPETGLGAITTSTADLRTWLVLDPSKFWVNLNPSEPDRIVDEQLGQTNAGRALLEADFAMKRTQGKMIDPKTEFGARYWRELLAISSTACYSSRMWIIPGDVQVREDGDALYIIRADLSVKAKAERVAGMSCTPDPAANTRNEQLEQKMIVPKVIEAVNKDPEYAPLRRAFLARVIAQWIRKRNQEGHRTSFDGLLDTGDLGPAKLQGTWKPRQVFDDYVKSIRSGEFTYEQPSPDGRSILKMTFGGVDFSKLDPARLSAAQMDQRSPRLAQTVQASQNDPTAASDGTIWLGETAEAADNGLLDRTVGTLRSFTTGRNGILIIIAVGLVIVMFGFRLPGRKRQASP
ncbi:hypothetical protein [Actinomadura rugatobispora]|uniref:Uncharacterized protein n=1 Tax=Actinomadura rugatobispora TaxID=1994 RepID=A0ABW0ZQ74_9ACTN|nr:hypothetical protein GCM10010200_059610 [Actinomadura rugatobispora]